MMQLPILPFILSFLYLFASLLPVLANDKRASRDHRLRIAMILWRGETDAERGFKDSLQQMGYLVKYSSFNAKQSKNELNTILREKIRVNDYDYIYTFGTTASLQTKAFLKEQIPQIFNVVSYPVRSKLVNRMDSPGLNIGGVRNIVPLEEQVKQAHEILEFKHLGVLFNPREKNSNIAVTKLNELGDQMNFEVIPLRSPPVLNRLQRNLEIITEDFSTIDAVYLPADSYIVSQVSMISSYLQDHSIKTIGATYNMVKEGVLMGSVADYYTLGKRAALILHKHRKGTAFKFIPVEKAMARLVINKSTMQRFDLHLENANVVAEFIH